MQTYLALDPGITTGYAIAVHDDNTLYLASAQAILTHTELYKLLLYVFADHVVCEDFEFRQGARDNLELFSVQLIGVVNLWMQGEMIGKLYMQKAAEGKGYYSDEALKKLEIYKRGVPHGMDALRHFMHWFTFKAGFQFNNNPVLKPVTLGWISASYLQDVELPGKE